MRPRPRRARPASLVMGLALGVVVAVPHAAAQDAAPPPPARHVRQATPHYAGYELAARYVDVEDDAVALTSRQVQAGGTYFVTPALRLQSNLVVPIGDDQPRHAVRWWSRLQFNF